MTPEKERGASPWSMNERLRLLAWEWCWLFFCRWTPKPFWRWRNFWLRLFGAQIGRRVFVHQRARIQIPWRIKLGDQACIGDRANLYSLGQIHIGQRVTVAQEAYLCTGTHDFSDPTLPLRIAPITAENDAFIGARAFILSGVTIGSRALIGAGAVVTKNVPADEIWGGNPAQSLPRVKHSNDNPLNH
jgi:putative colanic acid biosynthesis acetyltransferase WcaF